MDSPNALETVFKSEKRRRQRNIDTFKSFGNRRDFSEEEGEEKLKKLIDQRDIIEQSGNYSPYAKRQALNKNREAQRAAKAGLFTVDEILANVEDIEGEIGPGIVGQGGVRVILSRDEIVGETGSWRD